MEDHKPATRLLNRRKTLDRLGIDASTLQRWIRKGLFPKPVLLGPAFPVWPEDEVEEWIASRPRAIATTRGGRRGAA